LRRRARGGIFTRMHGLPTDLPARILEGSPDAVLVSDRGGAIRGWNAAAERLFGFTAGEALGASMDLIIPERLRGRHWGGWGEVMESGVTRYGGGQLLAVPAMHKDGRQLSVEFSIQLLKDGEGRIEWVVALFRDVTERFNKDKALKLRLRELEGQVKA
jgi:PAS domain S-box-containing protein